MREYILLHINGRRHEVRGADAFRTLSDYLRLRLGQVGTKIVCSEGDCGACSVLVGRPEGGRLRYRAVDSCICFVHQLDGSHVVTVEGLRRGAELHPVQRAMVECHGSQCGFCTPGFVVTMAGLFETGNGRRTAPLAHEEMCAGLAGNLCRCTGYVQIVDAGREVDPAAVPPLRELYPEDKMLAETAAVAGEPVEVVAGERRVFLPGSVEDAVAFLGRHRDAVVVSGATDIGVRVNKGLADPKTILSLASLEELKSFGVEEGALAMGAGATWADLEDFTRETAPEFHRILRVFGSRQIRHLGTIGGNIVNASPIADSLPFLFVTEAELEIAGPGGRRTVPVVDFYKGYKQFDLRPEELLVRVRAPLPREGEVLRLYKVSKRRDLDISTFTAGIRLRVEGGRIRGARVAYGGVGPVVLRLRKTEQFLEGRSFDEATFRAAGPIARGEISPISDVRGRAEFRRRLAENILLRFYFECMEAESLEPVPA